MPNVSKPFAVFDIDGTVARGSLTMDISQSLCRQQLIPGVDYPAIEAAEESWRRSRTTDAYLTYVALTIGALYDNLTRIETAVYDRILEEVLDRTDRHVYSYPLELIRRLRRQGYFILALSGSEHRAVARFCARHDFDDCLGADFDRQNGKFTGEATQTAHDKGPHLRQLIDKHGLDLAGSIAVGDTEIDVPMFELVDKPICFNPTVGLRALAAERSWPIVIERKGVVYQLEPGSQGHRLAGPGGLTGIGIIGPKKS